MSMMLSHTLPRIRNNLWDPRILKCLACTQMQLSGTLRRFCNDAASKLLALSEDSAQVLQGKNKQLRHLIMSSAWPKLTSFEVNGVLYPLPYMPNRPSSGVQEGKQLTSQQLQYMAGFFDGDGCVTPVTALSGCMLHVRQSFEGAEVLLLYQAAFGGCIRLVNRGIGLRKPVLTWERFGRPARAAASILARNSIVKKRQLEIASSWPEYEGDRRARAVELAFCKQVDSSIRTSCSWGYFTGFFDAEGHVNVSQAVTLTIAQKYVTVLDCLQAFLLCETGIAATIRHGHGGASFTLNVNRMADSKRILKRMLESGMVRKTQQAFLALERTAENAASIRRATEDCVGQQMFGKRLDEAGLLRAAAIKQAQQHARYHLRKGRADVAAAMLQEVDELKREHAVQKARLENSQLHEYLCNLKRAIKS